MNSQQIALIGYGAMGKEIERIATERSHSIVARFTDVHPLTALALEQSKATVAIDFSHASQVMHTVEVCASSNIPVVIGTTGWNSQLPALLERFAKSNSAIIYGSNFSVGMNMFMHLVQLAGKLANSVEEYDVFMHELHHHRKVDSPSGTAISLAEILLSTIERKKERSGETQHGAISAETLHVSSTRGGEIPGTHIVYVDSLADTIELTHRAKNRSGFALGSVLAAEWCIGKQGMHDFHSIFESVLLNKR